VRAGPAIWTKVVALAVKLVEKMSIAVTAFGKRVDHVGPGFIIDRIAVVVLAGVEQAGEFLSSLIARSVSI